MTTYHKGWDTISPDPGEVDSWRCRVCGAECLVARGVLGQTSAFGSPRRHDRFACPRAGEEWHGRAYELRLAIEAMPSRRVRALMEEDLSDLLAGQCIVGREG